MRPLHHVVKIPFLFLLLFLLSGCFLNEKENKAKLRINEKEFKVIVVSEPQEKSKGLSGKEKLAEDQGMLFIYEKGQRPEFWMKGMLFPLDFIWVKGDRVVDMNKNVEPEEVQPPETITPSKKVDKVLEVNSGTIEEYDIEIGDRIHYDRGNS